MKYDCQKITEAIGNLQQMKQAFDTAFREGIGDPRNSLSQKEAISFEIKSILEHESLLKFEAKKILGKDFLGSEAIALVFGRKAIPKEIPPIPFTLEELKKARDSGDQFLILRTDQIPADKLALSDTRKSLENPPMTHWALVTKEPILGTTDKNYLDQTEQMIKYLQEQVFKNREMPKEYLDAIIEFESQKEELRPLSRSNIEKEYFSAARRLVNLKITQLCRQSRDEVLYDLEVYHQSNRQNLLSDKLTWTSSYGSDGNIIGVGSFDASGACAYGGGPGLPSVGNYKGVCFSRTV
jgi:hypothetical protein